MGQQTQLSRNALLWQLIAVACVVIPHINNLPLWVLLLTGSCLGWRLMVHYGRWAFPHWSIRAALVFFSVVGLLFSYRAGAGITVAVSLLIAGFSLKILEIYHRRDSLVVIFVSFLVVATTFLFDQSVLIALYVLFALIISLTALMSAYQTAESSFIFPLKRTLKLALPAIPLMVVLFLVMPRLGPLWDVSLDRASGKTGLSDTVSPGDISRLTRSAEVAFRARFSSRVPQQRDLYWRAMVLPDFDGRRWLNRYPYPVVIGSPVKAEQADEVEFQYEMILEPNQLRYIPVLEWVSRYPSELKLDSSLSLSARQELMFRKQYQLGAVTTYQYKQASKNSFQRELRLPPGNPQAREFAQQLRRESADDQQLINQLLAYYQRSFRYTLSPPRLGVNSVDEFLFSTQSGFCEHFASATVFTLRAAGIPSRMVVGYQGGEWNPFEQYFQVRQYDAHAWIEAWLPDKGWLRIDPTAAVAPERVEQSADELYAQEEQFLVDSPIISFGIGGAGWIAQLRLRMEAFNYGWHRWVLNYHHQQKSVLQHLLGEITPLRIALLLLLPFLFIISASVLLMLRRDRVTEHWADTCLNRLSTLMQRHTLQRDRYETCNRYCQRLAALYPDAAVNLSQFARLYEAIRYGENDSEQQKVKLKQLTAELSKQLNNSA